MIGVKMTRQIYSSKHAGEIIQALIDAGYGKVKYEHVDGSTIGAKDYIYIEAETCQWHISKTEVK